MFWAICINHVSSFCKLDALISALHAYVRHAFSGQHNDMFESLCLGFLPPLSTPFSRRCPPSRSTVFKYKRTNPKFIPPTTSCIGNSHAGPLSTCPNYPITRYQTTRGRATKIIQSRQCQACLPCLTHSFQGEHSKGSWPQFPPLPLPPDQPLYFPRVSPPWFGMTILLRTVTIKFFQCYSSLDPLALLYLIVSTNTLLLKHHYTTPSQQVPVNQTRTACHVSSSIHL